jgi:NRPS condensation-like uncharacterized protein
MDFTGGPQLLAFIRRGDGGDTLLLKASHIPCDAGGVKEISADLAMIYTRLESDPGFVPEPRLGGSRAGWQILKFLPWYAYLVAPLRLLMSLWRGMVPFKTRLIELPDGPRDSFEYVTREFGQERVRVLAGYAKANGATLNDMMMAAFYRAIDALADRDGGGLRVQNTIDLRKWYIPGGRPEALCNLSSFEQPYLVGNLGSDFAGTLRLVSSLTRGYKRWFPGLGMFVTASVMEHLSYRRLRSMFAGIFGGRLMRNMPPMLTNLGDIPPGAATFGTQAISAQMLVPPIYAPLCGSGLSGYNGTLLLSSGVQPSAVPAMIRFYDQVESELPV